MPSLRPMPLAVLLAGALAAPASAAQFYVDDNGPGPVTPGCQDAGHPCTTIGAALTASRALAGTGDTINVAAGSYDEDLAVDQPQDDGLTIVGTRSGLQSTVISHVSNAAQGIKLGSSSAPLNQGLTLKDVTVSVPVGASTSKSGILDYGIGTTLDGVGVLIADSASTAPGIVAFAASGTTTLHKTIVLNKGSAAGIGAIGGAIDILDSGVAAQGTAAGANGITLIDTTAHVADGIVRLPAGSSGYGIAAGLSGTDVTIDSTLIEGGQVGVIAQQSTSGSVHVLVRRSTIDAATAGVDDGGFTGSSVAATTQTASDAVAAVSVVDSLLVDKPSTRAIGGAGSPTLDCSNSILPLTAKTGLTCDAAGGNSFAAPSALFVDASSLDYRLKTDSPAIDAGAAGGPAAGEPDHDESGKPRNVDGNFDCTARPDLGALELQDQANTPPTVSADGPASGAAGTPLTFTATGSDAEDAAGALTYTWAFSDGASATGASVQHAFAAGSRSATVTVTDSHGCTATATRAVTVTDAPPGAGPAPSGDTTAPVVTKLTVAKRRLSFTLSEAAKVHAVITRRRCTRTAGKRRCRTRRVRALDVAGATGANATALPPLARGSYTLTIVATDAAGNASKAARIRLRMR